jgi:hypothetical protein
MHSTVSVPRVLSQLTSLAAQSVARVTPFCSPLELQNGFISIDEDKGRPFLF